MERVFVAGSSAFTIQEAAGPSGRSLIDVDDVALGHTTKLRWNGSDMWVWSAKIVHPPIIDRETFDRVQVMLSGRAIMPAQPAPAADRYPACTQAARPGPCRFPTAGQSG
jgi:hypothetical protein